MDYSPEPARDEFAQISVPDGEVSSAAELVADLFFYGAVRSNTVKGAELAQNALLGAHVMTQIESTDRAFLALLVDACGAIADENLDREMAENARRWQGGN